MFENQYHIAWSIYLLSGFFCCFVWWRLTSYITHRGWRDLGRGFVVIFIFTPWYAGDTSDFLAPAVIVLLMDLLLEGAKSGMRGGIVLLFSSFLMLVLLTIRAWFSKSGK